MKLKYTYTLLLLLNIGILAAQENPKLVAHELNVEQLWRGCFGARLGAKSEYSGSYINDEQQSMATKETAKKVKHLVRESLGFWEPSDTFHKGRFWRLTGGTAAVYGIASIGLYNAWYKGYPQSSFHLFNDLGEWKEIDKTGHFLTAYNMTRGAFGGARYVGMKHRSAAWTAAGVGSLIQLTIEVMDGFSEKWGFSLPDIAFNTAGAGLFLGQELAWQEQRINLKVSVTPQRYPTTTVWSTDGTTSVTLDQRAKELYGSSLPEILLKDYNAISGWASFNIASFLPEESKFPKWLNVAVGYGANNLYAGYDNMWVQDGKTFVVNPVDYPVYRQYYLSFDVDFTRIKTRSPLLKFVFSLANVFKMPSPTLEYNSLGKLKLHAVYF